MPSKPERKTFVIIAVLSVFSVYVVVCMCMGGDTDLDPYEAFWRLPSGCIVGLEERLLLCVRVIA